MDEIEKLRVLLPHWIEHNGEHAAEFEGHAESAGPAKEHLMAAARFMNQANARLGVALALLGGPLEHHAE